MLSDRATNSDQIPQTRIIRRLGSVSQASLQLSGIALLGQPGEPNDGREIPVTVGAVLEGVARAESRDYSAILRQVLEALGKQNPSN